MPYAANCLDLRIKRAFAVEDGTGRSGQTWEPSACVQAYGAQTDLPPRDQYWRDGEPFVPSRHPRRARRRHAHRMRIFVLNCSGPMKALPAWPTATACRRRYRRCHIMIAMNHRLTHSAAPVADRSVPDHENGTKSDDVNLPIPADQVPADARLRRR